MISITNKENKKKFDSWLNKENKTNLIFNVAHKCTILFPVKTHIEKSQSIMMVLGSFIGNAGTLPRKERIKDNLC